MSEIKAWTYGQLGDTPPSFTDHHFFVTLADHESAMVEEKRKLRNETSQWKGNFREVREDCEKLKAEVERLVNEKDEQVRELLRENRKLREAMERLTVACAVFAVELPLEICTELDAAEKLLFKGDK